MWIRASSEFQFEVRSPTPLIFMLRPRSGAQQWVASESYTLTPNVPVVEVTDKYGNLCQRIVAPPGDFGISTVAVVETADEYDQNREAGFIDIPKLPESVLEYLLPSRYCESDRFGKMTLDLVKNIEPGYQQVERVVDWVKENIRFKPLSSTYPVSAVEVNKRREGVCRDLAQISMAMCRSICIPTRLVVGYLHGLEPMDIHAWFEAYIGDRWYVFDPTQENLKGGRIAIAYGRDAADVAIYNQYGPLLLPKKMVVSVKAGRGAAS
ncbi:transglutaminase family protein [Pseudomonadales bacterium]|nr:transglutaminase family protein [Gammaproteobacteria bacterium]MDB2542667.1 transglutaminase family protein [Pseudomonadales bacterium]